MDWSKIKTIFIITFLILDVYLLYQFLQIRDANKLESITETSFEEKLKGDEITYGELPKTPIKDQYLSAQPKTFSKGDLAKLKGQSGYIKETGTTIAVVLNQPIQLSGKFNPDELKPFIVNNVLYGDRYQYGDKNDKENTITYYQTYESSPLYKNMSGMIVFTMNADHQIISYQQTYLEGIEKLTEKEEILEPLKAIETLYQKGLLKPKSNITRIELGYSTLIQLTASQVLAPTWRFIVDDKESLFVNAFEGQIIQFNSDEENNVE